MMYHNSFDKKYRNPFGAVKENSKIELRLDVDKEYKYSVIRLWTPDNREELYHMSFIKDNVSGKMYYKGDVVINAIGLNWYLFILQDFNGGLTFVGSEWSFTGGESTVYYDCPHDSAFQITCYAQNFDTPSWFKNSIMYQIFPDRFNRDYGHKFELNKYGKIHETFEEPLGCTIYGADNYEFYGGNINGIIKKLDYLKKLGIDIVYLNPCFLSNSNHRYDASDFLKIDPMLGYTQDFKNLCKIALDKGIRIIVDISFNHVGSDSIYFNKYGNFGEDGAYKNRNSNYREWFNIHENGTYDCWWGFDTLPTINKNSISYKNHVREVIKYWSDLGISGFRLDVVDELPDEFLEWFRNELKSKYPNLIILGEVWDDASLKKGNGKFRSYVLGNNQDSIMNYPLRNMVIDFIGYGYGEKEVYHSCIGGKDFVKRFLNLQSNYPKETNECLMNFLSTHDVNRILTVFANCPYANSLSKEEQGRYMLSKEEYTLAIKRLKLAWSLLLMLPGNPCLFYGDESGLYGYNDPYNRKPMNWGSLDEDLLRWFIEINKFKCDRKVMKNGEVHFLYSDNDILALKRFNDSDSLIYVLNRSFDGKSINIDGRDIKIEPLSYIIY